LISTVSVLEARMVVHGLPLLYKGDDFTQTDVVSAVSSMPASAPSAGKS